MPAWPLLQHCPVCTTLLCKRLTVDCGKSSSRADWKSRHKVECRWPRQFEVYDLVWSKHLPNSEGAAGMPWRLLSRGAPRGDDTEWLAESFWKENRQHVRQAALQQQANMLGLRLPPANLKDLCQKRGIEPPPACRGY